MHFTLQPRFCILFISLWLSLSVLSAVLASGTVSLEAIAASSIAGLLAGLMQDFAVGANRTQFRAAETASQVRSALLATLPGKASIAMSWALVVCLIVLSNVGGNVCSLATIVCSFTAFLTIRDLASLPAVFRLSSKEPQ